MAHTARIEKLSNNLPWGTELVSSKLQPLQVTMVTSALHLIRPSVHINIPVISHQIQGLMLPFLCHAYSRWCQSSNPRLSPSNGHHSLKLVFYAVQKPRHRGKSGSQKPLKYPANAPHSLVHKGHKGSKINESISRKVRNVGRRLRREEGKNEAAWLAAKDNRLLLKITKLTNEVVIFSWLIH